MPYVRLLADFLRKLRDSSRLLELRFVLLHFCSSIVETNENRDRHHGRVRQLRMDDR